MSRDKIWTLTWHKKANEIKKVNENGNAQAAYTQNLHHGNAPETSGIRHGEKSESGRFRSQTKAFVLVSLRAIYTIGASKIERKS